MGLIRVFALLPLFLCACGGGGGGGAGGANSNADQQAALLLLEDCGLDGIAGFLEALGLSVAIVDPNGTSLPAIQVIGADQMQGHISWTVDLGGDPAPELLGDIQFLDDMGQGAEPPFDITQFVAMGLGGLDAFLAQLPDGWTVAVTINAVVPPLILSNVTFTYTAGAVGDARGNISVPNPPCGTAYTFSGAALADLVGAFPTLNTTSNYNSGVTTLVGATDFDGTDIVAVDGVVDGGTKTYGFSADLGAETVTALP